jgi:hypothetical protein
MTKRLADDYQIPVVSAGYLHRMCMTNFYTGVRSDDVDSTDNDFRTPISSQFNWQRLPKGVMPSYGPSNFSLASMLASSVIAALASRTLGRAEPHSIVWDANSSPWRFNTLSG